MSDIVKRYWDAYKALEPFAAILRDSGLTDDAMYQSYMAYKEGYELARAEFLESLGV